MQKSYLEQADKCEDALEIIAECEQGDNYKLKQAIRQKRDNLLELHEKMELLA